VLLRAQEPQPSDPPLQFALATSLFSEGRYPDALRAFDAASRSDDAELALRARKGEVRSALRIAEFEQAHREAQDGVGERDEDAEALALLGDAHWAMGLFDEADAAYERAAALDRAASRAQYGLARSLASRSQLDAALETARAALASAPRDPDLHALAGAIHERLLQFDEAADAYAGRRRGPAA
jgi:tetratricopeptide (TPR) repeat protein